MYIDPCAVPILNKYLNFIYFSFYFWICHHNHKIHLHIRRHKISQGLDIPLTNKALLLGCLHRLESMQVGPPLSRRPPYWFADVVLKLLVQEDRDRWRRTIIRDRRMTRRRTNKLVGVVPQCTVAGERCRVAVPWAVCVSCREICNIIMFVHNLMYGHKKEENVVQQ